MDRITTIDSRELADVVASVRSSTGQTLVELSENRPCLVLLPRHLGCAFTRQALQRLSASLPQLESMGFNVAIVHMSTPAEAQSMLRRYRLEHVPAVSDPDRQLYEVFGVPRGNWMQVMGPRVWLRGLSAALLQRHGGAWLQGDKLQLAGVLILRQGKPLFRWTAECSADVPDLIAIAEQYAQQLQN